MWKYNYEAQGYKKKKKENRSALSYFEQVKNFEKLKNCIQNSHCYSF